MAEDPQPMTLQQRIAALNAAHIGRVPGELPLPLVRPKPEVPSQRPSMPRLQSANIPHEQVIGTVTQIKTGNLPNGPPPLPGRKLPPPLPNRKSSDDQDRRPSVTSVSSVSTVGSNGSRTPLSKKTSEVQGQRIKAPAWGDCELPALPEKKPPTKAHPNMPERPKYTSRTSQQSLRSPSSSNLHVSPVRPTLPPPLPTRKVSTDGQLATLETSARKLPPVPSATALEQVKRAAFNNKIVEPQPEPIPAPVEPPLPAQRPTLAKHAVTEPPPIPHASRPDLKALQATKPRPATTPSINGYAQTTYNQVNECLICRDFSAPDHHASLFPRQQVASLQDLAVQLTSPFPSPTDKARAIFTWLHHNIHYDVERFFGGTVQRATPQSTLESGLAVCEGYAALFVNLATYAGLEAIVISGHGKGFGHANLGPGDPIPPYQAGHAWNAVKIDNGEWKLIDPCWGAGHVQGAGLPYVQAFHSEQFTMSNEQFGTKHFPANKEHFFLPDGRRPAWEEYIQINPDHWPYHCEPPTVFCNAKKDYHIGEKTVLPRNRKISVAQSAIVRFQFGLLCPHWTLDKHTRTGPPPLFMLVIHGVDGRDKDQLPLEHVRGTTTPGGGGDLWYVDVPARDLGAPGQTLTLFAITSFGNRQDCRGLTVQEFRQGKGRVHMSFVGIAAWDLV